MRLDTLCVTNFGHFERLPLDLSSSSNVVVLYGPNGAGKTTLLHALRGLLFGIPARSPYHFRSDGSPMEIDAHLRDARGEALQIKRSRGRTNTFVGVRRAGKGAGHERDLTQEGWAHYLGRMDTASYESFFGFTLADLRQGGEILKKATFSELLAGGALGGGAERVTKLSSELDEETGKRFKLHGRSQSILKCRDELERIGRERDQKSVDKESYRQWTRAKTQCDERRDALSKELNSLQERHARVNRLITADPDFRQQAETERQLADLHLDTPILEVDAPTILALLDEARRLREAISLAQEEALRQERRIADHPVNETLLQHGATLLNRLIRQVGEIARLRRQLPDLREKLRAEENHVQSVRMQFLPDAGTDWQDICAEATQIQQVLARLHSGWLDLQGQSKTLRTRRQHAEADREDGLRLLDRSNSAGLSDDLLPFAAGLDALRQKLSAVEHQETQWRKAQADVERRMGRLSVPSSSEGAPLVQRQLPDLAVATTIHDERQALLRARDDAERHRRERAVRTAETEARIRSLQEHARVPTLADLAQARACRDSLFPSAERQSGEYQRAMEEADDIADIMIRESSRVAELIQLHGVLAQDRAGLKNDDDLIAECAANLQTWQRRWDALWESGTDVDIAEPAQKLAWLHDALALRRDADQADELRRALERLRDELVPAETALRTHFNAPQVPMDALLSLLADRKEAALKDEGQRTAARERIEKLREEIAENAEEQAQIEQELDLIESRKRELSSLIRIDHDRTLPDAQQTAERLANLWEQADQLAEHQEDLAQQEADLDDFDVVVSALMQAVGASARDGETPEQTVERLHDEHQRVATAASARTEMQEHLDTTRVALQIKQNQAKEVEHSIANWKQRFEVDDDGALRLLAERAKKRAELGTVLKDLHLRLSRNLSEDLARRKDEERELADTQSDVLVAERERLEADIASTRAEYATCLEEIGGHKARYEDWGGDEAAALSAEFEQVRSDLHEEVEDFAVAHLARHILDRVVDRFARDNQPALLQRASELMGRITNGRFDRIVQTLGDKALAVRLPDGSERTAERLSTGECEQLFLALRLAYVLRYCESSEPLPLIMDDVLVNFDEERQDATLRALGYMAGFTQVLFFTCHERLKQIACEAVPNARVIDLPQVVVGSRR